MKTNELNKIVIQNRISIQNMPLSICYIYHLKKMSKDNYFQVNGLV